MSKKRKTKVKGPPKQPLEILIREKGKNYVKAIKEYWEEQDRLESEFVGTTASFHDDSDYNNVFLLKAFKLVFLFIDGIVFIKFITEGKHKAFATHIVNIGIERWLADGLHIPYKDGFVIFNKIKMHPGARVSINNAIIDGIFVKHADVKALRYDQPGLSINVANAIIDFQLSIMGATLQYGSAYFAPLKEQIIINDDTLDRIQQKVLELKNILEEQRGEEILQSFLRENPFLLKPSSEAIPKKKLGEDFVTDFVLLNILNQGPCYTLVEIERSGYPILTKKGLLSSQVIRAYKQTRDWDTWLESNKSYIQNKLPGFESPEYLIIIGRSCDLNESGKACLRSYNRGFIRTKIISYDDIVAQIEEFIECAKKI